MFVDPAAKTLCVRKYVVDSQKPLLNVYPKIYFEYITMIILFYFVLFLYFLNKMTYI